MAIALLQWRVRDVEEASGLDKGTVSDFTNAKRNAHKKTKRKLYEAFERAGIIFTADGCKINPDDSNTA